MISTTLATKLGMFRRARKLAALAVVLGAFVGPSAGAVIVRARTAVAYRPMPVYRPYHPVARTAAVVGTAVAVGAVVSSLPPSCSSTMVGNVVYQQCGSTWYRPSYGGTTVNYTVVNPPQ